MNLNVAVIWISLWSLIIGIVYGGWLLVVVAVLVLLFYPLLRGDVLGRAHDPE